MKIIALPGGKGKTTQLIKMSAEKSMYIVVADFTQVDLIMSMAKDLNIIIPQPLTLKELLNLKRDKSWETNLAVRRNGVLVDNVDMILERLLPATVNVATIRTED